MHNDKAGCLGLENTQKELATEKQVRIEADAQLMQNMSSLEITVANETTNRQEADTVLQTAIDNEISARQESDNALQLVIDAEVIDRKAAIGTLDIAINKEISDRQEADSSLQAAINGKAASTHTHSDKANFKYITMVDLGFTKGSYVSVRDFWQTLYNKIGTNGCIQFVWANATAAYVGVTENCVCLNGGSLFFTMTSYPAAWHTFSAIYVNGSDKDFYHIRCSVGSDTTVGSEGWSIERIANTSHIHDDRYYTESEINSKLANYANVYIGSSQPSSSETAKLWVVI